MADSNKTIQRFLDRMGERLGLPLALQQGVCALYDNDDNQVAVIEFPEHSENIVLHCRLGSVQKRADNFQRLLDFNFDVSALRGCWLALDQGEVRLCTQRELEYLNEDHFCHWVTGFIAQVRETRTSLGRLLA
ncbi:hypothetical protein AB7M22_002610 [Pseudomonas sp. ADAK2 TE3594]